MQCKNNLKQLALGCMTHENATGRLPTNGWGYAWTGDADRNNDWRQPAGWIYNVLPFMEQENVHDMGAGLGAWNSTEKKAAHLQRLSMPLNMLYCPTRRQALTYPWIGNYSIVNAGRPITVGRTDYACNEGDAYVSPSFSALWSSAPINSDAGPTSPTEIENPPGMMTANARNGFAIIAKKATGVIYCGSLIKLADISDGTSNTYLVGEKYLNPDSYDTGNDGTDNECVLMGDNADIARFADRNSPIPPMQDTPGYTTFGHGTAIFGSAHSNGFQMAFCDGSVHTISYTIEFETHARLARRNDGLVIDGNKY